MQTTELNSQESPVIVKAWHKRSFSIISAVLVVAVLLMAVVSLPRLAGFTPMIVASGSMEPALGVGDLAVARVVKPENVKVGDIVTYRSGSALITHRVINIEETPQGQFFTLRGDANITPDSEIMPAERIVGKVIYQVPRVGFIIAFAQSTPGLLLFILGPAVILALMWRRERKAQKATMPHWLGLILLALALLGTGFIVNMTWAWFSDSQEVGSNSFSTSASFATAPTIQPVTRL